MMQYFIKLLSLVLCFSLTLSLIPTQITYASQIEDIDMNFPMQAFNHYSPTEIVFGKEAEDHIAALVQKHNGR